MGMHLCKQISVLLSLLFALAVCLNDNTIILVLLLLQYIVVGMYGLKDVNRHITLLVFLIAFFTFLMGRIIIPLFMDTDSIFYELGNAYFSGNTTRHIIVCLFIAIQGILWGYLFLSKNYSNVGCLFNTESKVVLRARKLTYKMLVCIYPFVILELLEKVHFVLSNDYFSMYTDFRSKLPYIIVIIASGFETVFMLFLATMPSKKEIKIPMALFILSGVINLGTGQRGDFVLNLLLIITYLFLRNTIDEKKNQWMTKRGIVVMLISVPILLSFLFVFAFIRADVDIETSYNLLLSFFYQQGVSADVIGYGYDFDHKFPEGRFYLIGDIIDYFRHNIVAKILWGAESVEPQSLTHALHDYSFDDALTYFVKPQDYLSGVGLGGCYIAEAWHDLGYIGVFLISFLYGRVLALIPKWLRKNFWIGAVGLMMFYSIIFSPRSRADKPIYNFLSFVVLGIFIYTYYSVYKKSKTKS